MHSHCTKPGTVADSTPAWMPTRVGFSSGCRGPYSVRRALGRLKQTIRIERRAAAGLRIVEPPVAEDREVQMRRAEDGVAGLADVAQQIALADHLSLVQKR